MGQFIKSFLVVKILSQVNALHNRIISSHGFQDMLKYLEKIYSKNELPNFDNFFHFINFWEPKSIRFQINN